MKLKVTIDGKEYEVEVEATEPDHPVGNVPVGGLSKAVASPPPPAATLPTGPSSAQDDSKVCRSPVAGVVVQVAVHAGQSIQANDVLLVLEAMKMETSISAPVGGKVSRVHVDVGEAVQSGQIVVEFE